MKKAIFVINIQSGEIEKVKYKRCNTKNNINNIRKIYTYIQINEEINI